MRFIPFIISLTLAFISQGQTIDVEYDKNKDFSHYKTFKFGESQIMTPDDQKQVSNETLNKWIVNGVTRELELKGLRKTDSVADLIVTYAAGTLARTDTEQLGPLQLTPGANPSRSFTHEYRQESLIIDLNDHSNNLIWRVNSTTNMTSAEAEGMVDDIIEKGFKKFAKPAKRKKK